ncbi:MAG: DUF1905 domain-containing protein [Chitinophagales bacterium]|nr:DUF1905 domain-containing protein [Chitinophagales bacterium]
MQAKIKYTFSGSLWRYQGEGAWYFVSLPKEVSEEIRGNLQWQEEGWGRMKARASIQDVDWDTAIWFDTKRGTYILPIKASIRKKLALEANQVLELSVYV